MSQPRDETARRLTARLRWSLVLGALLLMLTATAVLTLATFRNFDDHLSRSLEAKSATLAWVLAGDFERASRYGLPLQRVPGVTDYLESMRQDHPEVLYLALLDAGGRPLRWTGTIGAADLQRVAAEARGLMQTGDPAAVARLESDALRLVVHGIAGPDGETLAAVAIGIDQLYAWRRVQDMVADILTALLVSVFIAFEIALALLVRSTATPIAALLGLLDRARSGELGTRLEHRAGDEVGRAVQRFNSLVENLNARQAALAALPAASATAASLAQRFGLRGARLHAETLATPLDVRLPLFVFIFAEELQKSFLPLYVRSLTTEIHWITPEVLVGLPISVYMAVLALATPWAGSLADRFGVGRIFLAGLVPAVLGFLGAALAPDLWSLLAARAATAFGYAAVTIAAQGYIAAVTPRHERAQGMSVFVGTLMAASICGTAVGGLLAAEFGFRPVFGVAALLGLLAGWLGWRMLAHLPRNGGDGPARPHLGFAALRLLLSNPRFLALLLFAAIPGKIVLTGFVIFGIPLYLADLGASSADTARVILAYSLLVVFLGPWASRLADRSGGTLAFTFLGTLLSGLAVASLDLWGGLLAATAAVAALGFAHAISISPQIALATQVAGAEAERLGQTTVLGLLRMTERIGSVAGPLAVGALVAWQGFETAMLLTGLAVVAAAFAFLALNLGGRR